VAADQADVQAVVGDFVKTGDVRVAGRRGHEARGARAVERSGR
jgi:hypothetical protein